MRSNSVILLLLVCLISAIAPEFSWGDENQITGSGGGWNGEDEYAYVTDKSYPKEDVNPDANEQKRLVVEWDKVSMGYMDYEPDVAIWKDDDALREDRELSIHGRLMIESVDGKSRQPIDWLQGVRVVVSRVPDKQHDWSRRQEGHDAIWEDSVIRDNGEFMVTVSPGKLRRPVEEDARFQVALSLGHKKGRKMTWRNTIAVLPQSVAMLAIPGTPAISETMQIINGAPSYDQRDFNPAKLVRAVNHLMPMGKEKAIHELREFMKIARGAYSRGDTRVDENIDTSDQTCVFLIVRLLFEPVDPAGDLPGIAAVPYLPEPEKEDIVHWPLHPVHLQDDVPFFLTSWGMIGGLPTHPYQLIDWAEEHGKIRSKPLRPLDNPMIAAERLASLEQTKQLYSEVNGHDFKAMFYEQAWNVIVDADPKIPKPLAIPTANTIDDPDWDERMRAAINFKIHWSESEQKYIME